MASLQSSVLIGAYSVAPLIAAFAIILYLSFCSDSEHRDLVEEYGCEPAHSSSLKHPWLFGIDFLLENARNVLQHRFAAGVHERFLRYGSTHASRIFHKHIINTIDPLNLECIMKTHADDYTIVPFRKKLVAGILGKGGSATEGQEWLESRCMIKIGLDCCAFDEQLLGPHAAALVAEIRCLGPTAFDPAQLAMRYAMDVTSQVLFGTSTATLSSMRGQINENQFAPQWTALCRLMRSMTIFFSQRQRLGKLTWSRQLREVQGRVIAFVDCEVQRARCLITHKNFPKSIVAVKDAATSIADGVVACTPDDTRTRGELLNILLAGHESVGLALSETLNLLAARPGVYARLRAVVLHHLGDREPSIADLNTIPYLEWTIAEANRLHPPLSVHGRVSVNPTVLPHGGGPDGLSPLFVKPGTYILYSHYSLNRNTSLYGEDVEVFRPERWDGLKPSPFEALPFGAGPRHCPGKVMASRMVAWALINIVREVEALEPVQPGPWEEERSFSFRNRHRVMIQARMAGS